MSTIDFYGQLQKFGLKTLVGKSARSWLEQLHSIIATGMV